MRNDRIYRIDEDEDEQDWIKEWSVRNEWIDLNPISITTTIYVLLINWWWINNDDK